MYKKNFNEMNFFLKKIIFLIADKIVAFANQKRREDVYKKFRFPLSVSFDNVSFEGNIEIGERTYINEWSRIDSGKNSKIIIGRDCAIGRYVHITSKTHSLERPTSDPNNQNIIGIEQDTIIGNEVWIGDFVFIKHGIKIGNNAIIGAHSFVNREVLPFEIVAGSPIKHIKYNEAHYSRLART